VKVLFFGRLSDFSTTLNIGSEANIADTDGLTAYLAGQNQALGEALQKIGIRIAVNQIIVSGNSAIKPNDEIAYMSPLSGG